MVKKMLKFQIQTKKKKYCQMKKAKKIKKMGAEHYGVAMYLFNISNHIGLFHFNSYSLTDELGLSKYKINNIFKEIPYYLIFLILLL